jgi:hypothetical protein
MERKRSHRKLDPDIKALTLAWRALKGSSCDRMLRANLDFLVGHFGYALLEAPR